MYTIAYLGMQQIVIILVIALLIFGPQKVPELGRQIGGALRDLKKMSNEVQSAFDLDDHPSYDRYEPPTYEYTPPVSTTYGHESLEGHGSLDQYGLPIASEHHAIDSEHHAIESEHHAIEAAPMATTEVTEVALATEPSSSPLPKLSAPLEEAATAPSEEVAVTHTEVAMVLEAETTAHVTDVEKVTGADAAAKSA